MEDEPVSIWDTLGKKTRMNFLWSGAQEDLSDFGLGTLSGSELYRPQNAFRSSELSGTWNFTTSGLPDELSQDYQMNFHWNFGLLDELSLELRTTTYGLGL